MAVGATYQSYRSTSSQASGEHSGTVEDWLTGLRSEHTVHRTLAAGLARPRRRTVLAQKGFKAEGVRDVQRPDVSPPWPLGSRVHRPPPSAAIAPIIVAPARAHRHHSRSA